MLRVGAGDTRGPHCVEVDRQPPALQDVSVRRGFLGISFDTIICAGQQVWINWVQSEIHSGGLPTVCRCGLGELVEVCEVAGYRCMIGVRYPDFNDLTWFQQQVQRPLDFSHISFGCGRLRAYQGTTSECCFRGDSFTEAVPEP